MTEHEKASKRAELETNEDRYEPRLVLSLGSTKKVVQGYGSGGHDSCGFNDRTC